MITDGEQTRFDFNLSFYGFIEGIALEPASPRRFGPPAHDQRGKHEIVGELRAPRGLGAVEEFERLKRLAGACGKQLKVSVPGPYTLSGRLAPNGQYPDRYAITEALLPIVRQEIGDLVAAGAEEICVDEPSMSCYGYREDTRRFVDIFNRTVESGYGKARICTHLCFGNFKGHPVGWRKYAPLFPAFLDLHADEVHVEMANREYAELDVIGRMAERYDVAVGVIDVKSYHIETPAQVAECGARLPEARPGGQAGLRPRLRPEPDGALGGEAEAREHGGGGGSGAEGDRARMRVAKKQSSKEA